MVSARRKDGERRRQASYETPGGRESFARGLPGGGSPAREVPQAQRLVPAGRQRPPTVRPEEDGTDLSPAVTLEHTDFAPRLDVPQARDVVGAAAEEQPA